MVDYHQGYTPPPINASPRPFDQVIGLWPRVFQMDEAFFAQEASRANGVATLIGVIIYGVATTLLSVFALYILPQIGLWQYLAQWKNTSSSLNFFLLCQLVAFPLLFYFINGLYYVGARLLGGNGSFGVQAYLISLFIVPLGIINQLVSFIPCLGALISLGISLYTILLTIRAVKTTHELSLGRTLLAVFAPVLLAIFLSICLIAMLALSGPWINEIFNRIYQGLITPTP